MAQDLHIFQAVFLFVQIALAHFGDGVLECITKYYLYRRFPKENEGFMTEKKIALVKNETIGRLALEMGLHKWYIISKHAEEKKIRTNLKKLGCLFESFLGALFLDFNKITIEDEGEEFNVQMVETESILAYSEEKPDGFQMGAEYNDGAGVDIRPEDFGAN